MTFRSAEEGVPYTGSLPRVQTVLFIMYLDTDPGQVDRGTGSITPYFSSEGSRHLPLDGVSGTPIRWVADGVALTVSPRSNPNVTCKGKLSGSRDMVELATVGCPALSDHISVGMVSFDRADR
jgi:hypothetical protein